MTMDMLITHTLVISLLFNVCGVFGGTKQESLETSTVKTDVGTFIGYVYRFESFGKQMVSRRFLGIPYAESPVGHLRFQKPKKRAPKIEPFDASSFPNVCYQQNFELGESRNWESFSTLKMSDDCLKLNVYTPYPSSDVNNLPVMIFIHGGAFVAGTPNLYKGDILSSYGNVIVVTIAYRVSIWGFLSTGDDNLPGNYGLFDQQMAIQWVYDNIGGFGGDPEQITLIGQSAGSASTVIQIMNPKNKGLIKRAVPMSGSMTCPWAFNFNPLQATQRLGNLVGCNSENTKELAKCLHTIPSEKYYDILMADENKFFRYPFEFVPVVDGDFIPEIPFDLINGDSQTAKLYQGTIADIDLMSGVVSNEGLMMITNVVGILDTKGFKTNRKEFEEKLVPEITRIVFRENASDLLNRLIIGEYTNWTEPDDSSNARDSFIKLSSDYVFNIQNVEIARVHAAISNKNTYMYLYDALIKQNIHILPSPEWSTKPQHGDELLSMFGFDTKDGFLQWSTPFPHPPSDPANDDLARAHITFLSNFAYTGNPNKPVDIKRFINTEWPTYDVKTQRYLTISYNMSRDSVGQMLFAREYNYWRNLLPGVIEAVRQGERRDYRQRDFCEKDCNMSP